MSLKLEPKTRILIHVQIWIELNCRYVLANPYDGFSKHNFNFKYSLAGTNASVDYWSVFCDTPHNSFVRIILKKTFIVVAL